MRRIYIIGLAVLALVILSAGMWLRAQLEARHAVLRLSGQVLAMETSLGISLAPNESADRLYRPFETRVARSSQAYFFLHWLIDQVLLAEPATSVRLAQARFVTDQVTAVRVTGATATVTLRFHVIRHFKPKGSNRAQGVATVWLTSQSRRWEVVAIQLNYSPPPLPNQPPSLTQDFWNLIPAPGLPQGQ